MPQKCSNCKGIGVSGDCSFCKGKGYSNELECSSCEGQGYILDDPFSEENLECIDDPVENPEEIGFLAGLYADRPELCDDCGGSGLIEGDCPECDGTGKVEEGDECYSCNGLGYIEDKLDSEEKFELGHNELKSLASELISLKKEIGELQIQEKKIRAKITPLLKEVGKIEVGRDFIRSYRQYTYKIFSRKNVLHFIRENYGNDLANKVDEVCSIVKEAKPGVQVHIQESHKEEKTIKCPKCGSENVSEIIYGEFIPSDNNDDNIFWGGCVITGDDPKWICRDCKANIY